MKDSLADRLVALFAQHWPPEAAELASRTAIEQTIDQTADELDDRHQATASTPDMGEIDPCRAAPEEGRRASGTGRRATAAAVRRIHQLDPPARPIDLHAHRAGRRRVPARLRRLRRRHHGLGPTWLRSPPRPTGIRSEPQQRGGACGSSFPATGCMPTEARSMSPVITWEPTRRPAFARLRVNVEKGYVTEQAADASYGQSGGVAIDALPLTDLDLAHRKPHHRGRTPAVLDAGLRAGAAPETEPWRQGVQDRRLSRSATSVARASNWSTSVKPAG